MERELPEGWRWARLGEICMVNPRREPLVHLSEDAEVSFVRMEAIDDETGTLALRERRPLKSVRKGYTFFREGDVLFAKITPCMQNGKAAIVRNLVNGVGFGSTEFHVLRRSEIVLPEWVHFFIRRPDFRALAEANFTGSVGQQRVPASFLEAQQIPLPPLSEQRRIVGRIEEVARRVEEAKRLRREAAGEADEILLAALREVFERGSGMLWPKLRILEICNKPQYGYTAAASTEPGGPRFLRITDIQNGQVNWDSVPYCRGLPEELVNYQLMPGDILFARSGATTGKSYVVGDCPDAVFASYLIRLRVREAVQGSFLYWFFQSPSYWSQIAPRGGAQPNVNATTLSRLQVPVPTLAEQRRIVAYLDSVQLNAEELKRQQEATQAELDKLIPSVLSKAFRGEL